MKKSKWILNWILLNLIFFWGNKIAYGEQLNFSILPELPENQVNREVGYFDLQVKPKQEQNLVIELINNSDSDIIVLPTIGPATTNSNGVVEYGGSKTDNLDDTAPMNMKDILKVENNQTEVSVPAKATKPLQFNLKMPNIAYDGYVAGGITFQQKPTAEKSSNNSESGMNIKNRYAYNVAVLLRQTDKKVKPDLQLSQLDTEHIKENNGILLKFKNSTNGFVNKLKIKTQIKEQGKSKILYETNKNELQIAPNTTLNYILPIDKKPLSAGKYDMIVLAESSKEKWRFTEHFKIQADQTEQQKTSQNVDMISEKQTNWWLYIIIGILISLLLIGLVVLKQTIKKNKR